ncbi:ANTAR domain-containing protein [Streptomyces sp. PsTaAH-137]|uniref:ANTAR domain-containing protein n=1 Tax=Streptomyces sp. PsTaAH-137 TaxID=1305830 RepID=UPI0035D0F98F
MVDQATGVVSAKLGCAIPEALAHLQEMSHRQGQTLGVVAHHVVETKNVSLGGPRP